jgi:hypothetical protein
MAEYGRRAVEEGEENRELEGATRARRVVAEEEAGAKPEEAE